MGYITAQQLIEKYGSPVGAALEYLIGTLDEDERLAVEQRLNPAHITFAKLILLDRKLDAIMSILTR